MLNRININEVIPLKLNKNSMYTRVYSIVICIPKTIKIKSYSLIIVNAHPCLYLDKKQTTLLNIKKTP